MQHAPATRRRAALLATARAVGCAAVLAAACSDPTAPPVPRAGAPDALEISAAGFATGSTTIRLDGGRLHYRFVPWGGREAADVATVTPDSAAWAAFWAAADSAGVWTWPRECANRDVVDGGGFTVDIAHGGARVAVVTSNAWPARGGRCDRRDVTPETTRFFAAVRALVGRPFPGRTPAVAALPREGPPLALRVEAWQFGLGWHEVTLRGDTLVLERRPSSYPIAPAVTTTVVPTADAWRAFWAALERAGVRYWPADCRDPAVHDGASYQLDLTVPAGRLRVVAVNAAPSTTHWCVRASAAAPSDALEDLAAFLDAVEALVGQPFP